MITLVDNFLNKITMYRLTLYVLIGIYVGGFILSCFHLLSFSPILMLLSGAFILLICFIFNKLFARVFNAVVNFESIYITSLILMLIVSPASTLWDWPYWGFLFWVSVWAMGSKYIFAIKKKHIFNPAAFAVALTALTLHQSATWWVGTLYMSPLVIIGGLLIVRKLRRFDLVLSFIVVALTTIISFRAFDWNSGYNIGIQALLYSPILFFSFIMLTEPLTAPPKLIGRLTYAGIVGFLFSPAIHIASLYSTPELALLVGNLFSYIISPKQRLMLRLRERIKIATDTYDFIFFANEKLKFQPGQYLEWTLDPKGGDSRGNRRYFTVASSPTEENEVRIGVKFYPNGSTFKRHLLSMQKGDTIVASQLAGEFTLPRNKDKKLVFLAGGIGVTPFRSMLKYLISKEEKRDIVMLYSNKTPDDIAYQNIISEAQNKIGLKNIYTVTDPLPPGTSWRGETGFVNSEMIKNKIPDYLDRHFYLSGTHGMVVAFDKMLRDMGVRQSRIKKDFFPGFV